MLDGNRVQALIRGGVAGLLVGLLAAVGSAATAQARDRFDIDLFARVASPGSPEGIAVDSRGVVFVGTSPSDEGPVGSRRRSKVFAYDASGNLLREYAIAGQDLAQPVYGLLGMAFDGRDLLYAVDAAPPRILRLDPRTGAQATYVRFADVPTCDSSPSSQCSATESDKEPLPDYPVFAPDGTMYVTDLNQALIWRVPPGGGDAEVWFTDPGFDALFGPNGIQFVGGEPTLLVVLSTASRPGSPVQRLPGLYELPIQTDGSPGDPVQRWIAGIDDIPDGVALARSGNAYVPLAGDTGNAVAVVAPDGTEIARAPPDELANQQLEVPFDQPASAAFIGDRVLVTNHALVSRNPDHYAVLDVFAEEAGQPLFRPLLPDLSTVPALRPRLIGAVKPRRVPAGQRSCFRFRVRSSSGGPVAGARIRFAGKKRRTSRRGRRVICRRLRRVGKRRAFFKKPGFLPARVAVRVLEVRGSRR